MKFTEYFQKLNELRLNSLVNDFPVFESEDISLFIENQFGGSDFVDYIFRLVFPEIESNKARNINSKSFENFTLTLNFLSSKSLTQLWLASIRFGEIIFKNTYFSCLGDFKKVQLLMQIVTWIEKEGANNTNIRSFWKMISFAKKGELNSIQKKEVFRNILAGFEEHFTNQEMHEYIEENLEKLESIEPEFHEFKIWILREEYRNERYDMESILNLIHFDYTNAIQEYESTAKIDKKIIKKSGEHVYLNLEYLVRFFKEMPEESRFKLWDYFQIHPNLSRIIHEEEKKTFNSLLINHFQLTNWDFGNSNSKIQVSNKLF